MIFMILRVVNVEAQTIAHQGPYYYTVKEPNNPILLIKAFTLFFPAGLLAPMTACASDFSAPVWTLPCLSKSNKQDLNRSYTLH